MRNDWLARAYAFLKSLLLLDILSGIWLTFKYMFKPSVTINYPYEKTVASFRYKGEHALRKYANGEERCIACKLCEVICPAQVITIEGHKRSDGARKAIRYDLDASKCIYCGLCEEACPVDAIVETQNVEFAVEKRSELYYNKERLLQNGEMWENYLKQKMQYMEKYK